MLDKAQIVARLQSGETMDQILDELTQDLNTAEKEYQESEAKRIEEEKEADRVNNAKRAAVDDILDAICDYLVAADAIDMLEEVREVDTDKVIDMLDGTIKFARGLEAMKNLEFQKEDKKNDIVGYFFNLL